MIPKLANFPTNYSVFKRKSKHKLPFKSLRYMGLYRKSYTCNLQEFMYLKSSSIPIVDRKCVHTVYIM